MSQNCGLKLMIINAQKRNGFASLHFDLLQSNNVHRVNIIGLENVNKYLNSPDISKNSDLISNINVVVKIPEKIFENNLEK